VFNYLRTGYQKLKNALLKTGSILTQKISALFSGHVDENTMEKLEELFYEADFGVETAQQLAKRVRALYKENPKSDITAIIEALKKEIQAVLAKHSSELIEAPQGEGPTIILVVGVNGNGKTTTVAKLAKFLTAQNKKVLIAAADTFRAAAIEQLETWAERLQVPIVKGTSGSDPAAVTFDAVTAGKARHMDVVIVDTAGRLHTKTALMQELDKIGRSCRKVNPTAPHETLLVLDASTGQNAIDQAKTFHKYTPITGLILTKMDGTARGGIVVSIQKELGIPIKFIGVGEGLDDLEPFDAEAFVSTLL
jgi:fused signal recognition particle receptor